MPTVLSKTNRLKKREDIVERKESTTVEELTRKKRREIPLWTFESELLFVVYSLFARWQTFTVYSQLCFFFLPSWILFSVN